MPAFCMPAVRVAAIRLAVAAGFALALGGAVHAAELPSQTRKAKPPDSAKAQKACNIGGMTGVIAGNGVCVKLSGSVTAGFGGASLR